MSAFWALSGGFRICDLSTAQGSCVYNTKGVNILIRNAADVISWRADGVCKEWDPPVELRRVAPDLYYSLGKLLPEC